MRVLFLNPVGGLGGAERCLLDMLAGLRAEAGIEPSLLAFADGPLLSEVRQLGIHCSVVPMPEELSATGDFGLGGAGKLGAGLSLLGRGLRMSPSVARYTAALRAAVELQAPDIVHANGIKAHVMGALVRPRRAKLVWHIHDFLGERPLVGFALKALVWRAHLGIANSLAVAADARRLLPRLRVEALYNAIDTDVFAPGPVDPTLLDRLSGLEPPAPGTLRVGLIAAYARWKGQEVLLKAAAELAAREPRLPVRFYIVGGPLYATRGSQYSLAELTALASELGLGQSIGFVPFQRDPEKAFRALDIVVHASTKPEPFGRTIVEAMATAKPVVVARAGGAAELFTDGVDAVGYTPGSPSELAEAILRLRSPELRAAIGGSARKLAVSRFSSSRLGPELSQIYSNLVGRLP